MKYTICGYSQLGLMEYNLTNDDALLLRVISDIYLSGSAKLDFIVHENLYALETEKLIPFLRKYYF